MTDNRECYIGSIVLDLCFVQLLCQKKMFGWVWFGDDALASIYKMKVYIYGRSLSN